MAKKKMKESTRPPAKQSQRAIMATDEALAEMLAWANDPSVTFSGVLFSQVTDDQSRARFKDGLSLAALAASRVDKRESKKQLPEAKLRTINAKANKQDLTLAG